MKVVDDTFYTVSKKSESEYKDKGSKFIGLAFPFGNVEELKLTLSEIRVQYPKLAIFVTLTKLG